MNWEMDLGVSAFGGQRGEWRGEGKGGERGKVEGKEGKGRGAIILLSRFPLSGFRPD